MTDERQVELLRDHLLGAQHAGAGLIRRVAARVGEITHESGPGFRTGSVIGAVDHHYESEEDDGRVFDLLVGLMEFDGRDVSNLTEHMRVHGLTDRDLLIGGDRLRRVCGSHFRPYLLRVRDWVGDMLNPSLVNEIQLHRCYRLERYLREWLGANCDHLWDRMAGDPGTPAVFVCARCRARRAENHAGQWIAT